MLHFEKLLLLALALMLTACEVSEPVAQGAFGQEQLVLNSQISGAHQIFTVNSETGESHALTDDPGYDHWWPRISPDRSRLLYYRAPLAANQSYAQAELWVTDPLGLVHRRVMSSADNGWTLQAHAEWSPDGSQLLMCAGIGGVLHLAITDSSGQNASQLTFDGQWNCDPSWAPDGKSVLFNRCETPVCGGPWRPDLEIYRLGIDTGLMQRLTYDNVADYDPYYSPDGSQIAWLRLQDPNAFDGIGAWSIFRMAGNGSQPVAVIDDGSLNSKPAWNHNGDKIYFHRIDESTSDKWQVFEIAPDGSGLGKWEFHPGYNVEYPAVR